MNERSIFIEALEKNSPAERSAYLDESCAGDATLRLRVEALLKSHLEASSFLEVTVPARLAEESATSEGTSAGDDDAPSLAFLAPSDKPGALGRLGHYEVLEVIGRGGFGIVVRAFDEMLHRVVAIKVMAPELAATSPPRKRFLREARAAAAIRHDNVVNIYSVEESPIPYLVMEFIDGQTLQQKLDATGPLEVPEVRRLGQQIAAGLAVAHEIGLTHRDIKPGNILLEKGIEQRVKITDFGLARAADDASLTRSGMIAGTPMYMAPEQAAGETIDHRADLFSLGSVLYVMVSGRPPFRGSTTVAVLKRVVEDTPRPIQEIIPETPQWLCDVIAALHAKNPADRIQSAAAVAEQLRGESAPLQHAVTLPSAKQSALSLPERMRHWAAAAAVLLLLLVVLGLTEAAGVTHFRATVIRIFTPEGTLVVEVDDPSVKVTIEGDGGLVITGAGLEEIRLRPGSYRVVADKDGQRVPLERELVRVTSGLREVVKVKLEPATSASPAAPVEKGAFVLLGGKGVAERKFDALADAVQSSSDGDTIEVRGNGPFVTDPIKITGSGLNILAAEGYRPVIKLSEQGVQSYDPLLETKAALTLEGLEFQRLGQKAWKPGENPPCIIFARGASLGIANCRFRSDGATYEQRHIVTNAVMSRIRNCLFLTPLGTSVGAWGDTLVLDNCVHLGGLALSTGARGAGSGGDFRLSRNTLVSQNAHGINFAYFPEAKSRRPAEVSNPLKLEATENVFDASHVLHFGPDTEQALDPKESESSLVRVLTWKGRDNVYQVPAHFVLWTWPRERQAQSAHGPRNVEDWGKFWNSPEPGSVEGAARYQGGDLLARLAAVPERLIPEDFRLRADSAGYRAGPDGKDLGADVDLVGPGPAYERWKKTPQYQEWLKETGQAGPAPKIDNVLRQANEHVAQGDLDQAAQEFSLALSLIVEPSPYGTERLRIVAQFVSSDELFERVVKLRAKDVNLWSHRAHHLAEAGRFEESIACYQKRLDLGPDGAGLWQIYSLALLARNDDDAYRNLCEKMLAAFANHSDPMELAQAALAMAAVPDSVKDKQRAFRLAERAVNRDPNEVWWISLTYGAWLYRLDRPEEALVWLDKGKDKDYQGFSLCFLAMAHHRLGHAEEARRYADAVRLKKSAWTKATTWYHRVRVERLIVEMDSVLAAEPDKTPAP